MKRSWLLSLLLAVALLSLNMPAFADDSSSDSMEDMNQAIGALTTKVNDLSKKTGAISVDINGFVQQDIINDSTQSFSETVGDGKVIPGNGTSTPAGDNGYTNYSLRNSRIDFLAKSSMNGWDYKGYLEADFLGSDTQTSEYKFFTQPTLRIRHAYLQADSDGWSILAGQWWTLFGWNMDYVLATVTEAPVMATLYERVPQIRVTKTFGTDKDTQLQLAASAEKPDQDISQVPTSDFGIRFLMNDIKGRFCSSTGAGKLMPLSVGLSERNAMYVWETPSTDKLSQGVWASAVAADVLIPVLPATEGKDDPSIVLTSEWSYGAGDQNPFNGGANFGLGFGNNEAGNNPTYASGTEVDNGGAAFVNGSLVPVLIQHANGQIQIFLPPSIGTIFTAGYGEVFASNAGTLGGTYNDDSNWFVNVMQDVTPQVRVGLEYAQFYTHYETGTDPTDQRLQLSSWYRF